MAVSHVWLSLSVLFGDLLTLDGARMKRKESVGGAGGAKFIAGVPVLNYHLTAQDASREEDWIVVVEPDTTDEQIDVLCKLSGTCSIFGHPSNGGVPFFEMRGTEDVLRKVLDSAPGTAQFIEPNPRVFMIPEVEVEHGDHELTTAEFRWGLNRIGVSTRPNQGKGVNVYIMDTGIRTTHEDFGGRAIPALDMTSGSAVECKGSTSCAQDVRGHGTHCAGTAAGRASGVASEATVLAIKTLGDDGGAPWSWIIGAFDWLATRSARPAVASASLGGPGIENSVRAAVDAAVTAGVTVLVAAGNAGKDSCTYTPAFVQSSITVGASNRNDLKAYFSNWGSCVNIFAPGTGIHSASRTGDTAYESKDGTSQACPHVAGAAALILTVSPTLRPAQVEQRLYDLAKTDELGSLMEGSPNKLVYVGTGDPEPTQAPCRRRIFCR